MFRTCFPGEGNRNSEGDLLYGLIVQTTFKQQNLTMGVSASKIPPVSLSLRKSLWIINNSSNVLYLGDSTVSTSNGFPVYPRAVINIQIEDTIDVWGVCDGAGSDLRIIEGA